MKVFKEMIVTMRKISLQRAARPFQTGGGAGGGWLIGKLFSVESSPAP